MIQRYNIKFPPNEPFSLKQDEAYFTLQEEDGNKVIRFHDYDLIFRRKGLYEQLFYERLKCSSPVKISKSLYDVVTEFTGTFSSLRVLDLGAGNGMMGNELFKLGVARIIGLDVIQEAKLACDRDYPGIYDAYYIEDLNNPSKNLDEVQSWELNCMTTIAAIGFDDIPAYTFLRAYNLIQNNGWIAFNIKDSFFENNELSNFSDMVRKILIHNYLEVYRIEKYRHRISIDGLPLYYYSIIGKKKASVEDSVLHSFLKK